MVEEVTPTVPPKSLLGKAVNYTLGQWPRLIKYLDQGITPIDNNLVENDSVLFVVGRKNWLFFDQPGGADAERFYTAELKQRRLMDLSLIIIYFIFLINYPA